MRTRRQDEEVLYPDEPIVRMTRADIDSLKAAALANRRRRMRLCAHRTPEASLHEMLIVHAAGSYIRPHKRLSQSKSYHVIEGTADVVLFDDAGRLVDVLAMGDYASAACFYFRLVDPYYVGVVVRSPTFVFHETTDGPFDGSQTIFAPWAPAEGDQPAIDAYCQELDQAIAAHKSARR
jgi:cupin fold WbuC family metalloprotein